jgi:hypothetical protein
VLVVEPDDARQRLADLGLGLAVAGEPDVRLLVEQAVDVGGQAHEQVALVAEVEVERGPRDAGGGRDPADVELGVGRALDEEALGGLQHGGLHLRALGRLRALPVLDRGGLRVSSSAAHGGSLAATA